MSDAISLDALPAIPATLAIPLFGRAEARRAFPELGFADPFAEALVARVHCRAAPTLRAHRAAVRGTVERTRILDGIAAAFLGAHPAGTVLTLGAGLCTRRARLGERGRWVDLDLPQVAALRRGLFPDATVVAGDLAAPGVCARAVAFAGPGPVLVILEGVTMFLDPAGVEALFGALGALPAGSEIAFDRVHPWIVRAGRLVHALYPSIRVTGARYRWGLARARDLCARWRRLRVRADDLFSRRHAGLPRAVDRALRRLTGDDSLYDIAHIEVTA